MKPLRPETPIPPRRRARPLHGLRALLVLGAVGFALSSLLPSCSLERDYETLSFFFDGVPDPNAVQDTAETPFSTGDVLGPTPDRPDKPRGSSHPPYTNQECDTCHIFAKTPDTRPSWLMGSPKLVVPVEELCARCHEAPRARYVHGPVAMLRCDLCHSPHDSRYPHLLESASVNEVCLSCHSGETFMTQRAHQDLGPLDCTTCHDPHASDYPFLLKVDEQADDEADEQPAAEQG